MSHLRFKVVFSLFVAFFVFLQVNTLLAFEKTPIQTSENDQISSVRVLHYSIDGGIGPAQAELTERVLAQALNTGAKCIVLQLDTPGGLVSSMREIVKVMLNSPVPFLVWVGPRGARAASAGVFLVAASSFAGMAPQTTMGAASPVDASGKDVSSTMTKKVVNDLVSFIRSMAARHGRNLNWYEESVRNSITITSERAATAKVVAVVAPSVKDFLVQAGKHGIPVVAGTIYFTTERIDLIQYSPSFRYDVSSWLLDLQIAYLLLLA